MQKVDKYESRNEVLEKEIQNIAEEISGLKELLNGHKCTKQPQKPVSCHHHFEQQHFVNANFQHVETKASNLGMVGRQEVQQPQPNSFNKSWCDNHDESQEHSIEQFLNDLHEDNFWDNL